MTDISGSQVVRSAGWMVGARLADRAIGFTSTLVLARLLTPADFGLVAMAMAVVAVIELVNSFGFEIALIRAKDPEREMYDTIWTLNVAFGIGCSLLIAALAIPVAIFYGDERLQAVMLTLAVAWAVGSFTNVGIVDWRRQMQFGLEFRFLVTTRLIGMAVTLIIAVIFRSYWALLLGMLLNRTVAVALSYLWHPFRPRLMLAGTRDLFSFSVWLFVDKIATVGSVRAADFIIGRLRGAHELGVYRLADEIAGIPGGDLVAPINRVLLPGVARLTEQGASAVNLLATATTVVAYLIAPACIGIACIADVLVPVLLGVQWIETIPIIRILSIATLFSALWANQYAALLAGGYSIVCAASSTTRLLAFVVSVVALAPAYGTPGVAYSVLISSACGLVACLVIGQRVLSFSLWQLVLLVWRPLLCSVVMGVAVRLYLDSVITDGALGMELLFSVLIGVVAYSTCVVATLLVMYVGGADRLELVITRWLFTTWKSRFSPLRG